MEQGLGFKELYEVCLKATYPIEIGGKTIETGETIARFDKILLANFQELKNQSSANGGYDNRSLMHWDETKELRLNFIQGVFSKTQWSLMTNAKLIKPLNKQPLLINKCETLESGSDGSCQLSKEAKNPIFVYDKNSGDKIAFQLLAADIIKIEKPYQEIIIDYYYSYNGKYSAYQVGEPLTQGYLTLTGKMRVKDDITGQVKTGILNIPRLKLMSDLSMRLGEEATPVVGRFDAVALPVGGKGDKKVMEILFLEDDVDSDM